MVTGVLNQAPASTNTRERIDHSQELSEFQCATIIRRYLCNKSSQDTSLLLNVLQLAVSAITTKWKRSGTAASQPRSGRLRNQRAGQWVLGHILLLVCQLSAEFIASDIQTSCGV